MSVPGPDDAGRLAPADVVLRAPDRAHLPHRARWMSDPATMTYNVGFDVPYAGYHRDTGCIDFPEADWDGWLHRCGVDADAGRAVHAFVEADGVVVGEVGFRVVDGQAHLHVVIEAQHAGHGYGSAALDLVLAEAFARTHVAAAVDDFPATRPGAEVVFRRRGFVRSGERVTLTREAYEERR